MFSQKIVSELAAHFHRIVLAILLTSIVPFSVEMREIQRDTVLRWRYDFPNAILVPRVSYRKRGARDSSVLVLEHSATGI